MKRIQLRSLGLTAAALALMLGTAACGSDDEAAGSGSAGPETSMSETPQAAMDEPFGAACDQVPADGAGSYLELDRG